MTFSCHQWEGSTKHEKVQVPLSHSTMSSTSCDARRTHSSRLSSTAIALFVRPEAWSSSLSWHPSVIFGILRRVFWPQTSLNPREKRKTRSYQSRTSRRMGFFSNDGASASPPKMGSPKDNCCQFNKIIPRNAERRSDIRCLSKQRAENSTRTTGQFDSRTQCQGPGWPSNCTWRPRLPWTTANVKLVYRNLMQASNFGGPFAQLFLWIFI